VENTKNENLYLDLIIMNKISLLILAGGLGTRYKGQKQVDKITETETLMEFALFDALNVGIQKFVFIINDQFPTDYRIYLNEILTQNQAEVHFVLQEKNAFVPIKFQNKIKDRNKPLGTAHAVLCAKEIINEPFITMNADDFYGRMSFQLAIEFVRNRTRNEFGIIGFELGNTLSENGKVSRGICEIELGYLKSVKEHLNIQKREDSIIALNEKLENVELKNSDVVSMNFWVLHPSYFEFAEEGFLAFLENSHDLTKDEFYLPFVIDQAIQEEKVQVNVEKSSEKWMGLTYYEDKNSVQIEIQLLKEKGIYPQNLWT
jgi:UTP-glucose-1-phosphate uridylyltransferase